MKSWFGLWERTGLTQPLTSDLSHEHTAHSCAVSVSSLTREPSWVTFWYVASGVIFQESEVKGTVFGKETGFWVS